MGIRADVLLWAQRVVNKREDQVAPHVLLDISHDASIDEIQTAFHNIARTSHPDLHRNTLTPDEMELVTAAYAKVASAYAKLRSQRMQTTRIKPLKTGEIPPVRTKTGTVIPNAVRDAAPPKASAEMSSKALVCYRKAEQELRRGDLKMAVLQLKLAIAADPQSQFLRKALAEVQAEADKL